MGKPSATGQPTRPTQPFILPGSINDRPVYRMCAQVVPSAEYLRGHRRVAVDVTALRRLWKHLPVLGLVILACVPVYAIVVAVC